MLDLLYKLERCNDELTFGKLKWELYEKYGTTKRCPHCNSQLLISDLPQYEYLCFECDENFYGIEVS